MREIIEKREKSKRKLHTNECGLNKIIKVKIFDVTA